MNCLLKCKACFDHFDSTAVCMLAACPHCGFDTLQSIAWWTVASMEPTFDDCLLMLQDNFTVAVA